MFLSRLRTLKQSTSWILPILFCLMKLATCVSLNSPYRFEDSILWNIEKARMLSVPVFTMTRSLPFGLSKVLFIRARVSGFFENYSYLDKKSWAWVGEIRCVSIWIGLSIALSWASLW
jgi:hypothetical protein